ncbi:hypothetical protein [Stackebrandtia soli]|uniref:hypothetical protein n=1 Tax=Stackebrandtia soli TaxID=1892856 RepID=UPI0039E88FCA
MTTLVWSIDVRPERETPIRAARRPTEYARSEPVERDPHRERLARERERDAARKIRRDRYRIPEPEALTSEWDRLGWRERVLNAHRDRVDRRLAERRARDRTPPLIMRAVDEPEPARTAAEKHNRDHWRDLARRILDRTPDEPGAFDWWGNGNGSDAGDSESGRDRRQSVSDGASGPPTRPFEFRRPEVDRAIGRATIHTRQSDVFAGRPSSEEGRRPDGAAPGRTVVGDVDVTARTSGRSSRRRRHAGTMLIRTRDNDARPPMESVASGTVAAVRFRTT